MREKIQWGTHLLDLVVVILGVTIAFALNNWKENRKENELEKQYLSGIMADLEKDIIELEGIIDTTRYFLDGTNSLINEIQTRAISDASSGMGKIFPLYANVDFIPYTATYNSLSASGDVEFINDFKLKRSINDLYTRQYEQLRSTEDQIRQIYISQRMPYFQKNLKHFEHEQGNTNIFYEDEFFNQCKFAQYSWSVKLEIYKTTLEHCRVLKKQIDQYLNP